MFWYSCAHFRLIQYVFIYFKQTDDIANRRRLSTPRSSPVAKRSLSLSYKRSTKSTSGQENKNPKTGWFKSLDRLSRKKSSAKSSTEDGSSSLSKTRPLSPRNVKAAPVKNLRFFGDTDMESNASLSKGKSKYRWESRKWSQVKQLLIISMNPQIPSTSYFICYALQNTEETFPECIRFG